jgi:hypothetical protein
MAYSPGMLGLDRLFALETPPASLKAFEHERGEAVFPIAHSSTVTLGGGAASLS